MSEESGITDSDASVQADKIRRLAGFDVLYIHAIRATSRKFVSICPSITYTEKQVADDETGRFGKWSTHNNNEACVGQK